MDIKESVKNTFEVKDKTKLNYRIWKTSVHPGSSTQDKKVIILSHGLGEYSGRYNHVAEFFNQKGISVYALDHRGHGESPGPRGYVNSFSQYVEDLGQFVTHIWHQEKDKEFYLLGHSMGGLIAIGHLIEGAPYIHAAVLSSPLLGIKITGAVLKRAMAQVLSKIIPSLGLYNEIDLGAACRDQEIVRRTLKDPLVHQKITPRLYTEMLRMIRYAWSNVTLIHHPLLLVQAGEDKIVDRDKAIAFVKSTSSRSHAIHVYDGFYHEVLNDIERIKVLNDIHHWMIGV